MSEMLHVILQKKSVDLKCYGIEAMNDKHKMCTRT